MEARPTCYLRGGEVTLRGEVFSPLWLLQALGPLVLVTFYTWL